MFMNDSQFVEPIARFRIMYNEELPAEHRAHYLLNGIDPDNRWSLEWSFNNREAAEKCLAECRDRAGNWSFRRTYRMVDARDTFMQLGAQAYIDGVTHCVGVEQFQRANEKAWWTEGYEEEEQADRDQAEADLKELTA